MAYNTIAKQSVVSSDEFKLLKTIYRAMDTFFLDPIIGFFIPGLGDLITAALSIPFIITSIFKLRSIPLTLAVIYNCLVDMLLGLVPVIGDIGDIVFRSYKKNYKLIVGYVEEDPEVVDEIKGKALKTCVLITCLCIAIRLVFLALGGIVHALTPKSCTQDDVAFTPKVEQVAPSSKSSSTNTESLISNGEMYSFDFTGYIAEGTRKYNIEMHIRRDSNNECEGYYRYLNQPNDLSHRIPLSGDMWASKHTEFWIMTLIGGENGTERFDIDLDDTKDVYSGDWCLYDSQKMQSMLEGMRKRG